MYRDEIWYRKLEEDVNEHRDDFTEKKWQKYRIDRLLRTANRVREFSDDCEVCKAYQHTLTRLEEELQELPDSKAQRQYQTEQLREMGKHFVEEHGVSPRGFFLRRWLKLGLIAGAIIGVVLVVLNGNLLLLPLGIGAGAVMGAAYGWTEDQKYERRHKLL
jgi:hypothetical protein